MSGPEGGVRSFPVGIGVCLTRTGGDVFFLRPVYNSRQTMMKILAVIILLLIFPGLPGSAQDSGGRLSDLSAEVAEKRARLDALYDELEYLKDDFSARAASLTVHRSNLEVRLEQERLAQKRLLQELEALEQQDTAGTGEFQASMEDLLNRAREYILTGIPFHTEGRLAEIDGLIEALSTGDIDPAAAAARLWNFLESELALAEESGIYRQTIELDGRPILADAARVGLVFLYFRTYDNRYGYALAPAHNPGYMVETDREARQDIAFLFDSLEKNLRTGRFTLPLPAGRTGEQP